MQQMESSGSLKTERSYCNIISAPGAGPAAVFEHCTTAHGEGVPAAGVAPDKGRGDVVAPGAGGGGGVVHIYTY